jgi:hypothetical protein
VLAADAATKVLDITVAIGWAVEVDEVPAEIIGPDVKLNPTLL